MFIRDMIKAKKGEIAETVILPGDPLRTKYFSEVYLEDAKCYNTSYGLYGYTGTYRGCPVSIQTSGMGTPSMTECVYQLVEKYGCKNLIRVGSCASNDENVHIGDVILSMACTNESNCTYMDFGDYDFIPTSSFELLKDAYESALENEIPVHVGVTGCYDLLYRDLDTPPLLSSEMEGTALMVTASRFPDVRSLLIMTCGGHHIYKDEVIPAEKRSQSVYDRMMKIALEVAYKNSGGK